MSSTAESFELDLVEGELLIRDADEALELTNPTKLTGTLDTGEGGTGAVTGGGFTTPPIHIETVDEGTGLDVFADASFSQVSPATGSIDSDGNVRFEAHLSVHLDIEVENPLTSGSVALEGGTSPEFSTRAQGFPNPED